MYEVKFIGSLLVATASYLSKVNLQRRNLNKMQAIVTSFILLEKL